MSSEPTRTHRRPFDPDPDVVCTRLRSGDAVLLHIGTKSYYTLNPTGSRIWRLLSDGHGVDDIGRLLEREYEVTAEAARASVLRLLDELAAEGLVRTAGP